MGCDIRHGFGPLVTLLGNITATYYMDFLRDKMHHFHQILFLGKCPLYQVHKAFIHTAETVQKWLQGHEEKV